mmetsp:Transcript_36466/g.85697  ORF Transcript_36466/g.85697 Transcript_36466/m.85697 type:complete len:209 (-) Transcript_36466:108-734(-)
MQAISDMFQSFQNASDEALEIIYDTFLPPAAKTDESGTGPGFFGKADGFNETDFANSASGQWQQFWNGVQSFVAAVDWNESWIIGLMCFHALSLVLAITTRNNSTFQMILFCFLMGTVYMAEPLNRFLGEHHKSFSTQNYFDKHGVFMSTVWSTPMLLVGCVMLVQSLYNASSLLIKVKRAELIQRAKEQHKENTKSDSASGDDKKSK